MLLSYDINGIVPLGVCVIRLFVVIYLYCLKIYLFQNAKILEKKITQPPHAGFHPIFSQDPKEF